MDIIIRNGTVVTESNIFKADIGIKNGKIICISNSESIKEYAQEEINADGKYVFPGFIDVHTHLDLPITDKISSVDDFYTGTVAAAFGGTTTIIDYIVPFRNQTLAEAFKMWQAKAVNKAVIDYGFHMTISNPTESILSEIKDLYNLGITSIKCFTAYNGKYMMTDDQLYEVLKGSTNTNVLVCVHCENGYLLDYRVNELLKEHKTTPKYHAISRPPILEAQAIQTIIDIAGLADAPVYIAHLSTSEGLERAQRAGNSKYPVFVETCPQYLLLSDKLYESNDMESLKYICSPPLRNEDNLAVLWDGIIDGNIHVVATDHCPFNYQKEKSVNVENFTMIPNGLPGIEDRVHLMFYEGVIKRHLDLNRFVAITSYLPASIFGLLPHKGTINIGADADIVVFNPNEEWIISAKHQHQNVDYNPYEGFKVVGKSETVISRGEIIINNNMFSGQAGRGIYQKRKKSVLLK